MPAIVTVTANPSVDASSEVGRVVPEDKLRASRPHREPGGGGINVARAGRRLGADAIAVHTRGGASGATLERMLQEEGVETHVVEVAGDTRENITFAETATDQQFRFVMPGPELSADDWQRCRDAVTALDPLPSWAVVSGSLPPGLPPDAYTDLVRDLQDGGARVIVDTSGAALRATLDAGVALIKPNLGELSRLMGRDLGDDTLLAEAVDELLDGGTQAVVVSLGAGGAYVAGRDVPGQHVRSPTVPIRSKVGAGDSMVAGITVALARGDDLVEAARFGVAAGAAAVMTPGSELCRRDDTEKLYQQIAGGP